MSLQGENCRDHLKAAQQPQILHKLPTIDPVRQHVGVCVRASVSVYTVNTVHPTYPNPDRDKVRETTINKNTQGITLLV